MITDAALDDTTFVSTGALIIAVVNQLGATIEEPVLAEPYDSATVLVPDPLRFLEQVERVERLLGVSITCVAEQGKGSCHLEVTR
jgi:hypothetical protein